MADTPSRAGVQGSYLTSPYQVTVSYGDTNAGIVRGTGADWFGPLAPLKPIAPPEVAGRQWDFPSGYNLQTVRRPYEPISFDQLRQFAQVYDLLRLVIETRKDQFARQKWKIAARVDNKNPLTGDIAAATKLFNRPDGVRSWNDWSRVLLEELFVVDAPALYVQRNRGGNLISLWPLDGATIKPVIDDWGRRPMPYIGDDGKLITPVAYQQILKGFPAIDYTAADLIYRPRNVRATTPYGFGPVEQIFTTVNICLRRQLFLLNYFTEGNVPDSLVGVPAIWTPDQVKSFQLWWDDLFAGNLETRRRARFVPGDVAKGYVQLKEPELTGVFDEWMSKIICYAFAIPPNTFSKLIANRASAETAKEAAEEEGLAPILEWVKSLVDDILEFQLDLPGLEFVWQQDKAIDEAAQQVILVAYTGAGIITRNEARDALGRDPDPEPAADRLMVTTGAGLMPLDVNTIEGKQANMDAFGAPDGLAAPASPRAEPATAKIAKRDVSDEARDDRGRWTSGGSSGAGRESEGDKRERQKANARERAAASRARAKQRAKEAERASARTDGGRILTTPRRAAAETPEEEREDFKAVVKSIVRGSVLIAGAALVAELAPEAGAGIAIGKLAYVASGIGETMLWTAAEATAAHILVKLGFEAEHIDTILAALKEHVLGKSAGSAGDILAIGELQEKLPAVADTAVEMALDYVAEHAPDAPLVQHNAIADALEGEADKFKAKIAALTADDLGGATKMAKGGSEEREFYLIRHGATKLNNHTDMSLDRIRGWVDVPLAPDGIEEAKETAASLEKAGIDEIFSSDLKRASKTAEIIGDHIDVQVTTTKMLRPWDLGDFAGQTTKEAMPEICEYARTKPDEKVPGGESFNDFKKRALNGIIELVGGTKGLVALVTHYRVERLVKAWIAKGSPANGDIDLELFLKKGSPPGESEKLSISLPSKAVAGKLMKAGGRLAPVPFDRSATRKARAAVTAIMSAALAKVGAKAAAHVRARLRALGKAEESPEDISDDVDFSDFEEAVPDIADALAGVAADSARQTLVHIGVSDRADLMNQVNEGAVEAAHVRAAEMVGMRRLADGSLAPSKNAKNTITETTREDIRLIIEGGLADNIGSDAIAQHIEEAAAFSPERAELIAHTEVGNINSAASLDSALSAQDAGVEVLKGWLTAGDDRVEDICRGNAAAGFIALDEDFPSGDAAPLSHPRCRCAISFKVKEAENV